MADPGRTDGTEIRIGAGQLGRAILVVLAIWALANVVWLGREVLFVAYLAVLVAAFLSIFVDRLEAWRVPRTAATLLVAFTFVGALAGAGVLAWPTLRVQLIMIRFHLPRAMEEIADWIDAQYRAVTGELGEPNDELREVIEGRLVEEAAELIAGALPLLHSVVGIVAGALIVAFAGIYLTAESRLYIRGLVRLVPPGARPRASEALVRVGATLRRWIVGTVISMLIVGALTGFGLYLLGMPAAFALGFIAGVLEFIPIVGPVLAAIPALALALIISPEQALWVLLLYLAVQQIESNLVTPLVMKGAVHLPPALTILFQAVMAVLFGFLGLLLAVPMLAAAMVLVQSLYVEEIEGGA